MTSLWTIPLMLGLLVLKAFFSGSETALVSADRNLLAYRAKQGHRGARVAAELLRRPERILATTLVGTNLATVSLTALGTVAMVHLFGEEVGDLYAVLLFTPVLLVLGEIVPKSVFQQKADAIATVAVWPLRTASWLLWPIVALFSAVARTAARLVGRRRDAAHLFPATDQLRHVLEMAERASEASVFDRFRIERAIRFADTTVGEQMIPMGEVVGIERSSTTADAVDIVRRQGFHRLPVFEGHMGNVVGVVTLTVWDLLDPDTISRPLGELVRPAHYLSPLQTLDEVRRVLLARDDRMAIVVDEFGSAVGMITLQDVMAAVVGDIETGFEYEDSLPRPVARWEELAEDTYLVDGRLSVSQLNDLVGLDLVSTEFHTVGGLVVARLRHLAAPGESFVESGFRFTVEEATERTVRTVRVEREGA
ncbi:MAG: hemolysin family protein [Thermoanaerobaculia bacterium]|nr:hemolysin family protein [Thermoanaerobaculia bacterium]